MSEINQDQQQNTEQPSEATQAQSAPQTASAQKADIGKRIAAVIIDVVLISIVSMIVGLVSVVLSWGVTIAYILLRDGLDFAGLDNRSVGKKLLGLKVINTETGEPTNYKDSALRNITLSIPLLSCFIAIVELILVITEEKGIRLGDKIAKTMVIDE